MNQRKEQILSIAYQQGHISVRELAERLNVSESTIRRDLHGIASEGLLELNHGGASVVRNTDHSFLSKSVRNVQAKKAIAKMACGMISSGDQIFVDSGTTCFEMTPFLRSKRGLSIISSSIRTTQELEAPGLKVLLLAGQYRPERMDVIGPMALETLEKLRGYIAFIGTDGIGKDFGITSVDIESAHLLKLAVRNAKECVLLADHSKFDEPALYKIADFSVISTIITDKKPDPKWSEFFDKKNIKVLFPEKTKEEQTVGI